MQCRRLPCIQQHEDHACTHRSAGDLCVARACVRAAAGACMCARCRRRVHACMRARCRPRTGGLVADTANAAGWAACCCCWWLGPRACCLCLRSATHLHDCHQHTCQQCVHLCSRSTVSTGAYTHERAMGRKARTAPAMEHSQQHNRQQPPNPSDALELQQLERRVCDTHSNNRALMPWPRVERQPGGSEKSCQRWAVAVKCRLGDNRIQHARQSAPPLRTGVTTQKWASACESQR